MQKQLRRQFTWSVRYLSVTLVSTRLFFFLIDQKGEFVRIILVFFIFIRMKLFSAYFSFISLQTTMGAPKLPVYRRPGGS